MDQGSPVPMASSDLAPGLILPAPCQPQQHTPFLSILGPLKPDKTSKILLRSNTRMCVPNADSPFTESQTLWSPPCISRHSQIRGIKPWLTEPTYRGMTGSPNLSRTPETLHLLQWAQKGKVTHDKAWREYKPAEFPSRCHQNPLWRLSKEGLGNTRYPLRFTCCMKEKEEKHPQDCDYQA